MYVFRTNVRSSDSNAKKGEDVHIKYKCLDSLQCIADRLGTLPGLNRAQSNREASWQSLSRGGCRRFHTSLQSSADTLGLLMTRTNSNLLLYYGECTAKAERVITSSFCFIFDVRNLII